MGIPPGWDLRCHPVVAVDLDWCKDLVERHPGIVMQASMDRVLALGWDSGSDSVTVKETVLEKCHRILVERFGKSTVDPLL